MQNTKLSDNATTTLNQNQNYINQANAKYNLYTLRQKLQYHHLANPKKFTQNDITSVINSVFVASQNNIILVSSTALFLSLLLDVEEEYDTFDENNEDNDDDDGGIGGNGMQEEEFMFMSKDTLVASSFHYCECVIAREMGIYDAIHSAMRTATPTYNISPKQRLMPVDNDENNSHDDGIFSSARTSFNENIDSDLMLMNMYINSDMNMIWRENGKLPIMEKRQKKVDDNDITIEVTNGHSNVDTGSTTTHQKKEEKKDSSQSIQPCLVQKEPEDIFKQNLKITNAIQNNQLHTINVSSFGPKAAQIYNNVAKLKRIEIMSHAMIPRVQHSPSSASSLASPISISKVSPSPEKAASLRGLLLTTTNGDWNALAIRLSACLHRLQGILQYQQQQQHYDDGDFDQENQDVTGVYNKEMVREAREALQIYAPLAQR